MIIIFIADFLSAIFAADKSSIRAILSGSKLSVITGMIVKTLQKSVDNILKN